MKLKAVSFIYAFVSLCICICIYFLETKVNLVMLGYYGTTESVFSLLVISLIPILFCVFLLSFYKNKIISKISSLALCFIYVLRITAFIKNMSNLNFENKLTRGKAVFYGVLAFVFLLFALSFWCYPFPERFKWKLHLF